MSGMQQLSRSLSNASTELTGVSDASVLSDLDSAESGYESDRSQSSDTDQSNNLRKQAGESMAARLLKKLSPGKNTEPSMSGPDRVPKNTTKNNTEGTRSQTGSSPTQPPVFYEIDPNDPWGFNDEEGTVRPGQTEADSAFYPGSNPPAPDIKKPGSDGIDPNLQKEAVFPDKDAEPNVSGADPAHKNTTNNNREGTRLQAGSDSTQPPVFYEEDPNVPRGLNDEKGTVRPGPMRADSAIYPENNPPPSPSKKPELNGIDPNLQKEVGKPQPGVTEDSKHPSQQVPPANQFSKANSNLMQAISAWVTNTDGIPAAEIENVFKARQKAEKAVIELLKGSSSTLSLAGCHVEILPDWVEQLIEVEKKVSHLDLKSNPELTSLSECMKKIPVDISVAAWNEKPGIRSTAMRWQNRDKAISVLYFQNGKNSGGREVKDDACLPITSSNGNTNGVVGTTPSDVSNTTGNSNRSVNHNQKVTAMPTFMPTFDIALPKNPFEELNLVEDELKQKLEEKKQAVIQALRIPQANMEKRAREVAKVEKEIASNKRKRELMERENIIRNKPREKDPRLGNAKGSQALGMAIRDFNFGEFARQGDKFIKKIKSQEKSKTWGTYKNAIGTADTYQNSAVKKIILAEPVVNMQEIKDKLFDSQASTFDPVLKTITGSTPDKRLSNAVWGTAIYQLMNLGNLTVAGPIAKATNREIPVNAQLREVLLPIIELIMSLDDTRNELADKFIKTIAQMLAMGHSLSKYWPPKDVREREVEANRARAAITNAAPGAVPGAGGPPDLTDYPFEIGNWIKNLEDVTTLIRQKCLGRNSDITPGCAASVKAEKEFNNTFKILDLLKLSGAAFNAAENEESLILGPCNHRVIGPDPVRNPPDDPLTDKELQTYRIIQKIGSETAPYMPIFKITPAVPNRQPPTAARFELVIPKRNSYDPDAPALVAAEVAAAAGNAAGVAAGNAAGVAAGNAAGVAAGNAAGVAAGNAAGVAAGNANGVDANAAQLIREAQEQINLLLVSKNEAQERRSIAINNSVQIWRALHQARDNYKHADQRTKDALATSTTLQAEVITLTATRDRLQRERQAFDREPLLDGQAMPERLIAIARADAALAQANLDLLVKQREASQASELHNRYSRDLQGLNNVRTEAEEVMNTTRRFIKAQGDELKIIDTDVANLRSIINPEPVEVV